MTRLGDVIFEKLRELIRSKLPQKSGAKGNGRFAVATSTGLVRNENQDRGAFLRARYSDRRRDFNLAVVCDGLGGMEGGEEAAIIGLASFASSLLEVSRYPSEMRLEHAIRVANTRLYEFLRGRGGTTLTAAFITRQQGAQVCHVGDTRLYSIEPDRSLHQLTRDDTIAAALRKGEEDFRRDNRLIQFVGIGDELEPMIERLIAPVGTSYLLTSDGAHDLPSKILEKVVSAATSPLDLARKLTQLADMLGGVDNSTVVVVPSWLDDDGAPAQGLELTLLLPGDEFTILLPDFANAPRDPEIVTPEKQEPPVAAKAGIRRRITEGRAVKGSKSGLDAGKKRRRATKVIKDDELPLQRPSEVNVEFQNKQNNE